MLAFLATIAKYFLDLNRERTVAGLKAALARGRKGGRPRKLSDTDLIAARAMLDAGTLSVAEVALRMGVSRQALYSYFPRARTNARLPNRAPQSQPLRPR